MVIIGLYNEFQFFNALTILLEGIDVLFSEWQHKKFLGGAALSFTILYRYFILSIAVVAN